LPLTTYHTRLRREGQKQTTARVIRLLLRAKKIRKVLVPASFPLGIAQDLKKLNVRLKVRREPFFRTRESKTAEELKKINAALIMAEVGLAEGIQALKLAKIGKNRKLIYHNVALTSEKLRAIIGTATMQAGGLANHTIVAGGNQACNPHEQGHGPLKANEPIIIQVFPRSQKTGYYGDITRTVVRGRATDAVRKMYRAVQRAQDVGLNQLRPSALAQQVQHAVLDFFEREGFKTGKSNGRLCGCFHSVGHGVGLEVHERPAINGHSNDIIRPGQVVALEPGLYYPGIGAVRLEDVVLVTRSRPKHLSKFEQVLEIN
jgi:Xaa-Pro aminopeptidase